MKLESVEIENYRAIEKLRLPLDPSLTVLHGGNTCGKTSVLRAIARTVRSQVYRGLREGREERSGQRKFKVVRVRFSPHRPASDGRTCESRCVRPSWVSRLWRGKLHENRKSGR